MDEQLVKPNEASGRFAHMKRVATAMFDSAEETVVPERRPQADSFLLKTKDALSPRCRCFCESF